MPYTEERIINEFNWSALHVQVGFCLAAEYGFPFALRKQLARGAKKNGATPPLYINTISRGRVG